MLLQIAAIVASVFAHAGVDNFDVAELHSGFCRFVDVETVAQSNVEIADVELNEPPEISSPEPEASQESIESAPATEIVEATEVAEVVESEEVAVAETEVVEENNVVTVVEEAALEADQPTADIASDITAEEIAVAWPDLSETTRQSILMLIEADRMTQD